MTAYLEILALIIGLGLIVLWLKRIVNSINVVKENKDSATTILIPATRLPPNAECNTVLPAPIGSELCSHHMEIIVDKILHAPHEEKTIVVLQCTKCGIIDKTVASTSVPPIPPKPPTPKSECRHQWEKEKNVIIPSAFEQMEDYLISSPKKDKKKDYEEFNPSTAPSWMFRKTIVKERICQLCGEIDRVVASNFETEGEENDAERSFTY